MKKRNLFLPIATMSIISCALPLVSCNKPAADEEVELKICVGPNGTIEKGSFSTKVGTFFGNIRNELNKCVKPDDGYMISKWVDESDNEIEDSFIIPSEKFTVIAIFELSSTTTDINITVGPNGEKLKDIYKAKIDQLFGSIRTEINKCVRPSQGYRIAKWVDEFGNEIFDSFVIPKKAFTLKAIFELVSSTTTITIGVGPNGKKLQNEFTADIGASFGSIRSKLDKCVEADEGYVISKWVDAFQNEIADTFVIPSNPFVATCMFEEGQISTDFSFTFRSDNTAGVTQYIGLKKDVIVPSKVTNGSKVYTITSIENSAFMGHTSLTSITLPASITKIGSYALCACTGITDASKDDTYGLRFNGLMLQWMSIERGSYWHYQVKATKVLCVDGPIELDAKNNINN